MSTVAGGWRGPNIIKDGLTLYLDADSTNSYDRIGNTWKDISGNSYNGTITNSPTFDNSSVGSFNFSASNQYITLGTPSLLNQVQVPLTICAWVKLGSASGLRTIYGVYKTTVGGSIYSLLRYDGGVLKYYGSNSSGGFQSAGTFTLNLDTWYFLAVSVSGSISSPTVTIYRNSTSESFSYGAFTSTPDPTVDFRIGASQAGEAWFGNISKVMVYTKALSTEEILQNYNATKSRFGL